MKIKLRSAKKCNAIIFWYNIPVIAIHLWTTKSHPRTTLFLYRISSRAIIRAGASSCSYYTLSLHTIISIQNTLQNKTSIIHTVKLSQNILLFNHSHSGAVSCRRGSCLRGFNACLPRPSIGSAKVESRLFSAMDSPDASSRTIARPSGDLAKRGRETGRASALFFSAAQDEDCWFCNTGTAVVNAPGRQKAVAAFWERIGVLAAPGAVISLHLRLFGPTNGGR